MRRTLEVIGWCALILMAWITLRALNGPGRLPDRIPTHFDIAGNPNGWGSSSMLLLLPAIGLGVFVAMTVVARFPAAFNFPMQVTAESRARAEELTIDLITWIKAELACHFAVLQWWIIQAARNGRGELPPLLMPGFLVIVFATIGWYLIAIFRISGGNRG